MSIIERLKQKGVYLFFGGNVNSIKIEGNYIVCKWNVPNNNSVIFGTNTRICLEKIISNFDDVATTEGIFEMYSPSIKYDDVCYSSTQEEAPIIGVYSVISNVTNNELISDYPALNLFNNGTFLIKIRVKDFEYNDIDYSAIDWENIFKRFYIKFKVYDKIIEERTDMAKTTPNDLILGKMQDNMKIK